ncbi:MAG: DUF6492 family protein [Steroidobacteraceae bacterium]
MADPAQDARLFVSSEARLPSVAGSAAGGLSYALVTPSFRLDLARCRLLTESIERWAAPHLRHYLIVDRRDVPLFRPLQTRRTELLVVEDLVPWWLSRIPGTRRFWLSLRTRPVKNWILQQIVKLSVPGTVTEDVLLFVDSDTFFVRAFDPRAAERDGKVPLFVEYGQRGLLPKHEEWHAIAAGLFGIAADESYDTNFIGNVICWRRQNALAMLDRIEEVTGKRWQRVLAGLNAFSEYTLYGMYVTRVLGESSGHWQDTLIRTLNYWTPSPLDAAGLRELRARLAEHHHSVMISAKSATPVAEIRKAFA